jgi:hypothetical protein
LFLIWHGYINQNMLPRCLLSALKIVKMNRNCCKKEKEMNPQLEIE